MDPIPEIQNQTLWGREFNIFNKLFRWFWGILKYEHCVLQTQLLRSNSALKHTKCKRIQQLVQMRIKSGLGKAISCLVQWLLDYTKIEKKWHITPKKFPFPIFSPVTTGLSKHYNFQFSLELSEFIKGFFSPSNLRKWDKDWAHLGLSFSINDQQQEFIFSNYCKKWYS